MLKQNQKTTRSKKTTPIIKYLTGKKNPKFCDLSIVGQNAAPFQISVVQPIWGIVVLFNSDAFFILFKYLHAELQAY